MSYELTWSPLSLKFAITNYLGIFEAVKWRRVCLSLMGSPHYCCE